ncbi:MAG: hypothetical protein ACI9MR_003630 [Myxococcota bacterium]|jgi:hypothetical protein
MTSYETVTDGLWRFKTSFRVIPGFYLPAHMTVCRLTDGTLLLYSPIELDAEGQAAIDVFGTVSAIIAPNLLHHTFLGWAATTYPDATVYAPAGIEKKQPSAPDHVTVKSGAEVTLAGVQAHMVGGLPGLSETVILHEPSGALVVADLVFNVARKRGWLTPLILWLAGASKGVASSRFVKQMVKDKAATRASLDLLLGWPFERLVPAHGAVVSDDAAKRFRAATNRLAPS